MTFSSSEIWSTLIFTEFALRHFDFQPMLIVLSTITNFKEPITFLNDYNMNMYFGPTKDRSSLKGG